MQTLDQHFFLLEFFCLGLQLHAALSPLLLGSIALLPESVHLLNHRLQLSRHLSTNHAHLSLSLSFSERLERREFLLESSYLVLCLDEVQLLGTDGLGIQACLVLSLLESALKGANVGSTCL